MSPILIGILSWKKSQKPGFSKTDAFLNMRLVTQACLVGIVVAIAAMKQKPAKKEKGEISVKK